MIREKLDELLKVRALIGYSHFYFPEDTDTEIKDAVIDYIKSHEFMYNLAGTNPDFKIHQSAQKGFTLSNGSFVFRVLLDYKGKEGQIAINFPNWRGWEKVLPLGAKNHFKIGGSNREPSRYRYQHGYYHSFKFKNTKEFIEFFNKYVVYHKVEK